MSILGIDYGDKKIGLAKSAGTLAMPLKIIDNTGGEKVIEVLKRICQDENIDSIVVGVPLSMSEKGLREVDRKNSQMKKVLGFIEILKMNVSIPVITEDERLSTKMAQNLKRGLRKDLPDDAIAAMLILQSHIDRNR